MEGYRMGLFIALFPGFLAFLLQFVNTRKQKSGSSTSVWMQNWRTKNDGEACMEIKLGFSMHNRFHQNQIDQLKSTRNVFFVNLLCILVPPTSTKLSHPHVIHHVTGQLNIFHQQLVTKSTSLTLWSWKGCRLRTSTRSRTCLSPPARSSPWLAESATVTWQFKFTRENSGQQRTGRSKRSVNYIRISIYGRPVTTVLQIKS